MNEIIEIIAKLVVAGAILGMGATGIYVIASATSRR